MTAFADGDDEAAALAALRMRRPLHHSTLACCVVCVALLPLLLLAGAALLALVLLYRFTALAFPTWLPPIAKPLLWREHDQTGWPAAHQAASGGEPEAPLLAHVDWAALNLGIEWRGGGFDPRKPTLLFCHGNHDGSRMIYRRRTPQSSTASPRSSTMGSARATTALACAAPTGGCATRTPTSTFRMDASALRPSVTRAAARRSSRSSTCS